MRTLATNRVDTERADTTPFASELRLFFDLRDEIGDSRPVGRSIEMSPAWQWIKFEDLAFCEGVRAYVFTPRPSSVLFGAIEPET